VEMNLQFESLRSYIKTGVPYDDDNQIVKNVILDIENADYKLKHENLKLILQLEETKKNIRSCKPTVNITRYNMIVDYISNDLFDMFRRSMIKTELQAEWKEYFHSLYDLIVVDIERFDDLYLSIIFTEMYSYWNLLPVPKKLDQNDKLYPLVSSIWGLFCNLRDEHFRLVNNRLSRKIVDHFEKNIDTSKECCRISNQIQDNEKMLDIYREILQWSIK